MVSEKHPPSILPCLRIQDISFGTNSRDQDIRLGSIKGYIDGFTIFCDASTQKISSLTCNYQGNQFKIPSSK